MDDLFIFSSYSILYNYANYAVGSIAFMCRMKTDVSFLDISLSLLTRFELNQILHSDL